MRAPVRASVLRHVGFSGCLDAVGCPFGAATGRCDPYLVVTGKSGCTATVRCPFWRQRDLPGDANAVREPPGIDCSQSGTATSHISSGLEILLRL